MYKNKPLPTNMQVEFSRISATISIVRGYKPGWYLLFFPEKIAYER